MENKTSNINIIDPNNLKVGVNNNDDLYIYVDLVAFSRGNTIFRTSNDNITVNSEGDSEVNLMGLKYKKGEHKLFTTDYTEIYNNGNNRIFEGFGIDNINIVVNSSYVPTVTIKFIDIKGQSFFNKGTDSPYSVITMFPPPLFKLTIKGYYGSAIEYKLHLVKYNSNFNADTGDFEITANFVGNTFAPLADILFRHVIEAPYIGDNNKTKNLDKTTNVTSTLELISRSKMLNNTLSQYYNNSDEVKKYKESKQKNEQLKSIVNAKYVFSSEISNLYATKVIQYNKLNNVYTQIYSLNNELILNNNYILYITNILPTNNNPIQQNNITDFFINGVINTNIYNEFIKNKITLQTKPISINGLFYNSLNLTEIFLKLNNEYDKNNKKLEELANILEEDKSNITYKILGFVPTVKNVFTVICNDIDVLFNKLVYTYNSSIDVLNNNNILKGKIINNNRTLINKNNIILYPFPDIINSNNEKIAPEQTNDRDIINIPETKFINDFISSYINTKRRRELEVVKSDLDEVGSKKWIPNNVYDIPELSFNANSPYINKYTPKDIIYELLNRYLIYVNYTYNEDVVYKQYSNTKTISTNNFQYDIGNSFLEFISKSEGVNLIQSLNNSKTIRTLLNDLDVISNDVNFNSYLDEYIPSSANEIYFNNTFKGIDIRTNSEYFGILTANESNENESINMLLSKIKNKRIFFTNKGNFNEEFKIISEDEIGFTIDKNNLLYFHDGNDNNKSYFIDSSYLPFVLYTISDQIKDVLDENNLITNQLITTIYNSNESLDFKQFAITNLLFINNTEKIKILGDFVGSVALPKFRLIQLGSLFNDNFNVYYNKIINYVTTTSLLTKIKKNLLELKTFFNGLSIEDKNTLRLYYNNNIENYYYIFSNLLENNDGNYIISFDDYVNSSEFISYINEEIGIKQYILINSIDFINGGINNNFNINNGKSYIIQNKNRVLPFLRTVYETVKNTLETKAQDLDKSINKLLTANVDNYIKQEVYYSFKNFVDRWLTSSLENENRLNVDYGYGIIEGENVPLINYFSFIDRAGNSIDDKHILDISVLGEFENDFNVNVLSVFSKLLGDNGYQFFPLQNFINFDNDKFNQIFDIKTPVSVVKSPRFTCMYISNTSNYANYVGSSFHDDGINFPDNIPNDIANSNSVNVFKVSFGENEQSIFNGIQINTEEHQPTNESLKIMSQILDGNVNEANPINLPQNLFSTLEQRSYTCKIDMLGNAMIQPTQYFQLENVPLFRGGYIILNVEHNIDSNNYMRTSFSGVRVSMHEKPYVSSSISRAVPANYNNTVNSEDNSPKIITDSNRQLNKSQINIDGNGNNDLFIKVDPTLKISKYLNYSDVIFSNKANGLNINNNILKETNYYNKISGNNESIGGYDILTNIKYSAKEYDKIYDLTNGNIVLTSYYRNEQLNTEIGGSINSEHQIGYAFDFELTNPTTLTDGTVVNNNLDLYNYIKNNFQYNQLINEFPDSNSNPDWIHFSIKQSNNRNEILAIN